MEKLLIWIKKYWFIGIIVLTMMYPLFGIFLEDAVTLSGVTKETQQPEMTKSGVWDGSFQTWLNSWWEENFPGRGALIKLRNQMLYSLGESPNANVIIGRDKYLYEPGYITAELMTDGPYERQYYDDIGERLEKLRDLLEEGGKELYVFITPSKADFFRDRIPARYMLLDSKGDYDFCQYSMLIENLEKRGIHYFDSVAYIREHMDKGEISAPLFYATGIHWSHPWGETCAKGLLEVMRSFSKYDLGEVSVTESESPEPVFPATDLYDSLNLIKKPSDTWYRSDMVLSKEGSDHPNIFIRGGSFMGQSTTSLIWTGLFAHDVHYENYFYMTDCYSDQVMLSGFTAYDEAPLDRLVGQSDIIVLEVNESAISSMSFGFIEYALEHPGILDSEYQPGDE